MNEHLRPREPAAHGHSRKRNAHSDSQTIEPGRPRKVTLHLARAIAALWRRGARTKEIASELDLGVISVRRSLESSGISGRRRKPCAISAIKGPARLHFAERVIDLHELCRTAALEPPVTVAKLAEILELDEKSALRAFYRMRDDFAPHGVVLEKEACEGESQIAALITFDLTRASAFVKREITAAEAVLTEYKQRKGSRERFRGKASP